MSNFFQLFRRSFKSWARSEEKCPGSRPLQALKVSNNNWWDNKQHILVQVMSTLKIIYMLCELKFQSWEVWIYFWLFYTGQFLLGNPKYFGMQIDDQDWNFNNPRMGYSSFFLVRIHCSIIKVRLCLVVLLKGPLG